jgi:riboflavin kinase / FMN adenylyltransferase
VGSDFHFGHGRKGNVALLREMGRDGGFEVEGVSLATTGSAAGVGGSTGGLPTDLPVDPDRADTAISSTRIRALVVSGQVEEAALLLGRFHQVRGTVVRGDRRGGSELGFPTANVDVPPVIALPSLGIYAGWFDRTDGSRWATAVSVGRRPTFYGDEGELLVEAYLLDFSGDLYGEQGRVSFVKRLRDELAFDSVDQLVHQIGRDVATTREVLVAGP